ncbi:MAG: ABC transporter permease [Acidobacteriota bacterium]
MHFRQLRGSPVRLFGLFHRTRREREFAEELESHLAFHIEDSLRAGMSPEEARRQALLKLGGVTLTKELYREQRGLPMLETLLQDLRFGLRMLRKNPGFAAVAVLTLALGIGANTAIFSVVNVVLLRPLPYAESERLVLLSEKSRARARLSASYPNYADWRARAQSFEGMAIGWPQNFTLAGGDGATRVSGYTLNWNFFPLLRVQPQLGRMFTEADDRYGAARTVMVSHGFWQRRFGGESKVIGQTLRLANETYTVIGVLPPGFEYFQQADVFTPLGLALAPDSPFAGRGNTAFNFNPIARLKPGVTVAQANSEMEAIGGQLAREYPKFNEGKSAAGRTLAGRDVRERARVALGLARRGRLHFAHRLHQRGEPAAAGRSARNTAFA